MSWLIKNCPGCGLSVLEPEPLFPGKILARYCSRCRDEMLMEKIKAKPIKEVNQRLNAQAIDYQPLWIESSSD